jgi:hypothetical protein
LNKSMINNMLVSKEGRVGAKYDDVGGCDGEEKKMRFYCGAPPCHARTIATHARCTAMLFVTAAEIRIGREATFLKRMPSGDFFSFHTFSVKYEEEEESAL